MSKYQESIDLLTVHRDNLLATTSFEEYRDAHVAYVDALIDRYKASAAQEPKITLEYRMVEPSEHKPDAQ